MNAATLRQRRFAAKYVKNNGNATQAAREAGYSGKPESLWVMASRLLRSAKVRAEIERLMHKEISEDIMDSQEVLQRLSKHARASLADVLTEDGQFNLKAAKENQTDDLLKKLKVRHLKDGSVEYGYEIHDPQNALVQMARVHKLLTDKVESTQNPIDSLDSAQSLYAQKYQELTKCSESEAKLAAQSAFSFTQIEDHSEKQAS